MQRNNCCGSLICRVRDLADTTVKTALNQQVRENLSELRAVADIVISARLSAVDDRSYDALMLDSAPRVADGLGLDAKDGALVPASAGSGRRFFHWPVSFPQVFISGSRNGFDAVIANPPFLGGRLVSGAFGTDYRQHLVEVIAKGSRGSADLVAYFFLRAASLSSATGQIGLLTTNTIAQGDTREIALDRLVADGWVIRRANKSEPWPGVAALQISKLWLSRSLATSAVLDGKEVAGITTGLNPRSRVVGVPRRLTENVDQSFQGSIVLGLGFTLTPDEAQALIDKDPRNAEVLFPYLNGKDLNDRPNQSASRWVINFFDWPLERARQYPGLPRHRRRASAP